MAALLERPAGDGRDLPRGAPARPVLAVGVPPADAALAARLADIPGIRLVAEAPSVVVASLPDAAPEVPLDGPADGPPVLVLAAGAAALAALRAGARGVVAPDASAAELAAALGAVARGLAVMPQAVLAALAGREATPAAGAGLTRREREVLDLLAAGASNKVIARRLGLSFHTAKAHVAAVLQKLGAGSRADAVARGARAGLVLL